jgi:hypothetical protein
MGSPLMDTTRATPLQIGRVGAVLELPSANNRCVIFDALAGLLTVAAGGTVRHRPQPCKLLLNGALA